MPADPLDEDAPDACAWADDPLPSFDPAAYPRRYRSSAATWTLHVVVAAVALAGACGLVVIAWEARLDSAALAALWAALAAALLATALWALALVARTSVTLEADAISVRTPRVARRMKFAQLAGRRRSTSASTVRLVPRPGRGAAFNLPSGLHTDVAWNVWLHRLPDLDERDLEASIRRLPELGRGDAGDWLRRFETMRRWQLYAVPLLGGLVLLSLSRWPLVADAAHAAWVLLALLPVAVVALACGSRGVFRLDLSTRDVRPSLLGLFGATCAAPWPRLLGNIHLADAQRDAAIAIACGLGGGALLWLLLRRMPTLGRDRLTSVIPLAALYLTGMALWTNQVADPGPVATHRTVVSFKGYTLGERLRLYLRVEPWAAGEAAREVNFAPAIYNRVSPGETVCLNEHPGRLGWAWFSVQPCAPDAAAGTHWPAPLDRALRLAAHEPQRQRRLAQWLRAGRIDEIDAELNALQGRYEAGAARSTDVLSAYRDFYDPNPDLDEPLDHWVERHPKSYAAWLARGTHRKFQAIALGSAGFERWVSPQWNAEQALDQQVADLLHATQLTAKPSLAYLHLLDAARQPRYREDFDGWLAQGIALDPTDLALHRKALYLLSWRGLEAQRSHVARLRDKGVSSDVVDAVQAVQLMHEGYARMRAGDADGAIKLFQQAQALKPWDEDRLTAMLEEAFLHSQAGRHADVIALMHRALAIDPDHPRCLARLGWAMHQSGQAAQALPLYRRAAELGDAWAQGYYGRLLIEGRWLPQDREAGARWINRAAHAGDGEAQALLREQPALRRLE